MEKWLGLINKYRDFLPVTVETPVITLHEGNTPLIKAVNADHLFPVGIDLYFKYDGANPTGSFKDRGMTLAISKALESGKGGHLRFNREHLSVRVRLRCQGRHIHNRTDP